MIHTRSHKEIVKAVVNCKVCMRLIRKEIAAYVGGHTSIKKAEASRNNGKLGGRPKKLVKNDNNMPSM